MRAFSTIVVAEALDIDRRRLDTLVGQHEIDGVRRARQGVSRAFSPAAVLTLAIALELIQQLEMSVPRALDIAHALRASGGEHVLGAGVVLRIDVRAIERRIAERLTDAVAAHPPLRRGRPPSSRGG